MYTLHSDEVVALISGDESVVIVARQCNGCYILLPFRPLLLLCVVIKPLIYIDIYPRISLVSVQKMAKKNFIWLKKMLIFSQIG